MMKDVIFCTIGGLGLFLFGMKLMSEGLKAVAGQKLKKILEAMTKHSIMAFFIGAAVTALIQSSSATSVMVIGFVNAGLLALRQAICVIIGTNVGTTVTAWLVSISGISAFEITAYALPGVALGFLMNVGGRTRRMKNIGQILLGLGLLFIGIEFMQDAFSPLKESVRTQEILATLGHRPFLAILAGMLVTCLLQSSSAAIAIVQILAMNAAFGDNWRLTLNLAIPFVLGCNIGTTITAQLAALQTNVNARRVAWAHTFFNIGGAVLAYPFVHFGWFGALVDLVSPWQLNAATIAPSIAVSHTVFNVAGSAVFLPAAGLLARFVIRLVPERQGDSMLKPVVLERHLLNTPEIALEQAQREIVRMARTAKEAIHAAIQGLIDGDPRRLKSARELEDHTDTFQFEITSYLSDLSSRQLSDKVSIELPVLLHTVNDLERVGDHAVNIAEIADRKIEQRLNFSDSALEETQSLKREIGQMFDHVIDALEHQSEEAARSVIPSELRLNRMQVELRRSHVARMRDGGCSPEAGLIFIDLVDNVEKVGDHLTNVAQAVIGGLQWTGIEPKTAPGARYDADEISTEQV